MATELKSGTAVRITITKSVTRDAARKTLERLFMRDPAVARPIAARSSNFQDKPKRRGGRIWTKRPNKLHADLTTGRAATIAVTPQVARDLRSVEAFVAIAQA